MKSETVMVMASARKKLPVTPVIEMSGRKTTIGVMVEPISGTMSSRRALCTARARSCPASRCRTIFSSTTMASSMTKPTAAASPPRVIRLKLWPVKRSTMKVMSSVTGMTSPATNDVPQSRKNSTSTTEDNRMPRRTASRTLEIESWTIMD